MSLETIGTDQCATEAEPPFKIMKTSCLIELKPEYAIPDGGARIRSFFGTQEDFEKIGGGKYWSVKRFIHIEEPPFYGEPTPCNNIGDIWAIQRRIIKYEGEKLDRALEDLRR